MINRNPYLLLVVQFWVLIFETKRIGVALIYREAVSFPRLGVSLMCPQTLLICSVRHIFFTELSYLPPTGNGKSIFFCWVAFLKESQEALVPRVCHRLLPPTWQPTLNSHLALPCSWAPADFSEAKVHINLLKVHPSPNMALPNMLNLWVFILKTPRKQSF